MLELKQVQKHYEQFDLDCSLTVKQGQITGLIGRNGAGKSTTFKAILDLIKIDSGEIRLFSKELHELTNLDRQQIGVVLADSSFSEVLTIQDVIPVLDALYPNFNKQDFIAKCHQFELPLKKKFKEFSTGMRAKFKLLMALSHDAKLLILDEPTAGLDVLARQELLDMLRQFMDEAEGRSILISSHISSDLEQLCDDFYFIHQGKVILHEDTDTLLDQYAVLKVDEEQFHQLDPKYILKTLKDPYSYRCLTDHKDFYHENYPELVIEKGSIDELIALMLKGE